MDRKMFEHSDSQPHVRDNDIALFDDTANEKIIRQAFESKRIPSDLGEQDNTSRQIQNRLLEEKVKEQEQRRAFREKMFCFFKCLLIIQYLAIIALIVGACMCSILTTIQPLLSIIIPATLGETYAIIKVMVKFVFSEGNFSNPNK